MFLLSELYPLGLRRGQSRASDLHSGTLPLKLMLSLKIGFPDPKRAASRAESGIKVRDSRPAAPDRDSRTLGALGIPFHAARGARGHSPRSGRYDVEGNPDARAARLPRF